MRILLFLATNLAVVLVAGFTLRLMGRDSYLAQNGIDYGSLLISKPMAKWITKARVINTPRTPVEHWLLETVAELAKTPVLACLKSPFSRQEQRIQALQQAKF